MKEIRRDDIAIHCGKSSDSFERLEELCNTEAERLLATLEIPENTIVSIPCWTADSGFPELIGVEQFKRDKNSKVVFKLDFTESTL